MPLKTTVKLGLYKSLEQREGRFKHLYLDTKGKVTIGVGHMIPNRAAIISVPMYTIKNNQPFKPATTKEKQDEYDKIIKLPWGQRYGAGWYKQHTSLIMKDPDINQRLDKHLSSFYSELSNIYKKSSGYTDNFDKLHDNVQLALFDMIFNMGATTLTGTFVKFNTALKAGDWKKAAL